MKIEKNKDKKHSKLFYIVLALIMIVSALIKQLLPYGFVLLLIKGFYDFVHP